MKTQKLLAGTSLRRPFVVTVSAVAMSAVAGCSGADASDVAGPGAATGESAQTSGCPETQPSGTEACTLDPSVTCGYKDCNGSPALKATCIDGQWSFVERSCNPPAPICPTAEPAADDTCALPAGTECGYRDCYGTPSLKATCGADGVWSVAERTCNPPAPVCPDDQPKTGDACDPAGLECGYKDCYGTPAVKATCQDDGTWSVLEHSCNPPAPQCPTVQPKNGGPCSLPPSFECGYKDCNGTPSVTATCGKSKTWSVVEMSCNPPPPPRR